jgi:hypothetical protein
VQFLEASCVNVSLDEYSKILIITPQNEIENENWRIGGGNHYFEIFESAMENFGPEAVDLFVVSSNQNFLSQINEIAEKLRDGNFSLCLASIEADPNTPNKWNWDALAVALSKFWRGTFIALSTDFAYPLHQVRFSQFIKKFPRTAVIAIDINILNSKYIPAENFSGPVFLPISKKSITQLTNLLEATCSSKKIYDIVFVGTLYDYRSVILEKLKKMGVQIGVNPHLQNSSIQASGTYFEYLCALRSGKLAINFSRANGAKTSQLKSRNLEAPLFGVPVLTDDELNSYFFKVGEEFLFQNFEKFDSNEISAVTNSESSLLMLSQQAKEKAKEINENAFWDMVRDASQKFENLQIANK